MEEPNNEVLRRVAEARAALNEDPNGDLRLGYRQAILLSMGPLGGQLPVDGNIGWYRRAYLALLSAKRAVPVWRGRFGECAVPDRIIEIALAILDGEIEVTDPSDYYGSALSDITGVMVDFPNDGVAMNVGFSAVHALSACLYDESLDPNGVDLTATDYDCEPELLDAAPIACAAIAGGAVWEEGSSSAERRAFWEWWLDEAVPEALAARPGRKGR